MKISEVQIGQCVKLASGGPTMVVVDTTASGKVIVTWQTAEGNRGQDTLPAEALVAAK